MKMIIDRNISALEFIELRDYMQNCIWESLVSIDSHDTESIMWHEDCDMEDYFKMWQEIYDELGTKIGEGLDAIAHEFILNDDTRADFEKAFEQARYNAFEEKMEDVMSEILSYFENDFEGFEELDENTDGYKMVCKYGDSTSFFDNNHFYHQMKRRLLQNYFSNDFAERVKECYEQSGFMSDLFAFYFGATHRSVKHGSGLSFQVNYYKRED